MPPSKSVFVGPRIVKCHWKGSFSSGCAYTKICFLAQMSLYSFMIRRIASDDAPDYIAIFVLIISITSLDKIVYYLFNPLK